MSENAGERYHRAGLEAIEKKDPKNAFALFLQGAKAGDADCQFWVGSFYNRGMVVRKDERSALMWFRKAAKQGHVGSMNEVGILYSGSSTEVQHNPKLAYEYISKAALTGNTGAVYNLAMFLESGTGCEKDYAKAAALYGLARNAGSQAASYALARMYRFGLGVDQSSEICFDYLKEAADAGLREACFDLALMYRDGEGCRKDLGEAMRYIDIAMEKRLPQALPVKRDLQKLIDEEQGKSR